MKLTAQVRENKAKLATLRSEGLLPAVVYGAKQTTASIAVSHADFLKLYKVAGETTLIDLQLPGGEVQVLVHEVQMDAATHKALHVDFLAVDADTKVTVSVPLVIVGESPAVKSGLGILNTVIDELEIEVLPRDIPQTIEVNVSGMTELGAHVLVSDISLPASAEAILEGDTLVLVISGFHEEKEEASGDIDLESIEVQKKGKKEEEAE